MHRDIFLMHLSITLWVQKIFIGASLQACKLETTRMDFLFCLPITEFPSSSVCVYHFFIGLLENANFSSFIVIKVTIPTSVPKEHPEGQHRIIMDHFCRSASALFG